MEGNESYGERKFQGTNVPGNESSRELSFLGAKVPGNESSMKVPGAKVLWNESSSIQYALLFYYL